MGEIKTHTKSNRRIYLLRRKGTHTPGCIVAMPVDSDDDSVCVTDVAADVDSTAINRGHKPSSFHKTYTVL